MLNIEGIIDDLGQGLYHGYPIFSKNQFLERVQNDIHKVRIISFEKDFINTKKEFESRGFSAIYSLYDGLYFLGVRENYIDMKGRILFTSIGHPNIERGGLFSYDFEKGECVKHYSGDYRDMKRYGNGFIALRENVGIIVYDQNLNEVKCISTKKLEMHGLGFCPDDLNIVYVVETAKDQIGVYDISNGIKIQEIKFSNQCFDNRHINDIMVDEQYIYLSIFSLSGSFESFWSLNTLSRDGALVRIRRRDFHIDSILVDGLKNPHTVMKINDDILLCDSLNRRLICNQNVLATFGGFLRGLCYDGHCILVGQSTTRHTPFVTNGINETSMDTGIYCFDPSRKIYRFINIPNVEIYSIIQ